MRMLKPGLIRIFLQIDPCEPYSYHNSPVPAAVQDPPSNDLSAAVPSRSEV